MSCKNQILCGERVIIGIRDWDACSKPESDLFINDLPGISLKAASKITSEEHQSGVDVIKSCIKVATLKVFDDFQQQISPYFDFNLVIETRDLLRYNETTILPATPLNRGVVLRRWRSELAEIYIETISVKSSASGVATVKIYDGSTLLKSIDVDLLADESKEVFVNLKCSAEEVKILMDDTNFPVYTCSNSRYNSTQGWSGFGGEYRCRTCYGGSDSAFYIAGWNGTSTDSNCYGIGVKASVRCYEENVICSVLPRMHFILWYKSGIEFLKVRINTDRLNSLSLFTKETAKALLDEYQVDYSQKYAIFAKSIYQFLKSTKNECLTCNGNNYVQRTP